MRTVGRVEVDEQAGDLDAGVVDQDVEPAELVDRLGDRGLPAGVVGDVEVHEAVALAERLGDLRPEVVLQVGDHDLGAGGGQRPGHALAEALGASGDEGLAAGQVEFGHGCSSVVVAGCGDRHNIGRALDDCQEILWTVVKKNPVNCQDPRRSAP